MPKRARRPYSRYRVPKGPHWVVAVDPGKWHCGVAIAHREGDVTRIVASGTVRAAKRYPWAPEPTALKVAEFVVDHTPAEARIVWVHERMQDRDHERVQREALDQLRAVCKAIQAYLGKPVAQFTPREWKGTLSGKTVHHNRLEELRLPADVAAPPRSDDDTWDAEGIVMYATGRSDAAGNLRR